MMPISFNAIALLCGAAADRHVLTLSLPLLKPPPAKMSLMKLHQLKLLLLVPPPLLLSTSTLRK